MNDLENFFYNKPHKICQKWTHYFPIYERFFSKFRFKSDFKMLEIGVSQGGSLDMWRDYFGENALIVGVDISAPCKKFEVGNTKIRIGSQSDKTFLQSLINEFGHFDVILDDGGHTMDQQITSFEILYKSVKDGGIYLVEDCHTSYHEPYGGGIRKHDTFIEFSKRKIDELNGRHIHVFFSEFSTDFMRATTSMTFYDSVVVFEKQAIKEVLAVEAGGS